MSSLWLPENLENRNKGKEDEGYKLIPPTILLSQSSSSSSSSSSFPCGSGNVQWSPARAFHQSIAGTLAGIVGGEEGRHASQETKIHLTLPHLLHQDRETLADWTTSLTFWLTSLQGYHPLLYNYF